MALLMRGATVCPICKRVIGTEDAVISFLPFIPNELDPLYVFNDANFHRDCFLNHPLADAANKRYEDLKEHTRHDARIDAITKARIVDPDDYFTLGHLTDDENNPLYPYNYVHLRRSMLSTWTDLGKVYLLVKKLEASGTWKGDGLRWAVDVLEKALVRSE